MKKAALKFKSGSGQIIAFLILAFVFASMAGVVYVVISGSPAKTPHAQTAPGSVPPILPPTASLTVNWKMPVGYVSFVDVGNKKASCYAASTTCTTAKFVYWPGSKVSYTIKVNSASGPVLQTGSVVATTDGRAVANWKWRYEVNVFPETLVCATAGDKCVKGVNVLIETYTAANLLPSTVYRQIVCAPDCAVGKIIQNTTAKTADVVLPTPTPIPTPNEYGASKLITVDQTCSTATGKVSLKFGWTPGVQSGFLVREMQSLDISLTNDNFASAYMLTANPPSKDATSYTVGASGGQIGPLNPGQTHYWRINTHYLNENWHTSQTASFTTIPCAVATPKPPEVSCLTVDFDHDGSVSILDQTLMSKSYGTKVGDANYNKIYDLDGDGSISTLDMTIASKFFGQKCPMMPL